MRPRLALLALLGLAAPTPAADPDLTRAAKQVLQTHCHRCHGQDGAVEGGFNYVLDLGKLAARKKVVPGNPDASSILRRIVNGTMPPPDEAPRPSPADVAALRAWIAAGAPTEGAVSFPASVPPADVDVLILADLDKLDRRSRRFQRYFTLTHLATAGLSADELQTYRNALSKLINSLSWHPKVRAPEPIDPAKSILRIDLRWYSWDATLWNRILAEYPYVVLDDSAAGRAVRFDCGTRVPTVRADWFVAAASRAPLYYDLLQLPGNLAELERQLRVDPAVNIQQERVIRVGFNGSGVSRNNRVLERHDSVHGAYWRTYDFDEPAQTLGDRGNLLTDRRNVFAHPLGPGLAAEPFTHAGGEAIVTLPNGLHAYYLMNAANDRLNKGPQAIVSDPRRPDRAVEAGVSCMSCHVSGILPKADQVRDHLEKNPKAFARTDADLIKALYPPKDKSLAAMEEDAKAYAAAVAKTGGKVSKTEPVSAVTVKYEADLDLPLAAAETGVGPDELRKRIDGSEDLAKTLGALRVAGGTVGRTVWLQAFPDLTRELKLGPAPPTGGPLSADATADADPLADPTAAANAVAVIPDGRSALVAGPDRSLRLRALEAGRDVQQLTGHTAPVWAVAISPDGRRGLSGSADGTVRVWDLRTAQEQRVLDGHASLVSAVGFSADGTKAISGGYDGAVVWWDLATGRELRRFEAGRTVHAIDLHPTKPLAAVAADRAVTLWNPATGEVVKRWEAHGRAATCVRFAEAGKVLATGGDDRRVRVWETATGTMLASLDGHEGSIRGVSVKPGGRWLLSASADRTVRLWDLTAKKEAAVFRKHGSPVLSADFLSDGTRTVSVDRDLTARTWDVGRFLTGPATAALARPDPPDRIPLAKP